MTKLADLSHDELFAKFADPDEMTRLRAGLELKSRDDNPVARLVELLGDARPAVRATAAYTLGQMATEAEALEPDDYRLEGNAEFRARIAALPAARPAVEALYAREADPDVRYSAFKALHFYGALDAARAEAAIDDTDPRISATAAFALRRLDPTSAAAARGFGKILLAPEEPGSNGWQEAAMMLEDMGPAGAPALPALEERLRDPEIDPDLRESLQYAVDAIVND